MGKQLRPSAGRFCCVARYTRGGWRGQSFRLPHAREEEETQAFAHLIRGAQAAFPRFVVIGGNSDGVRTDDRASASDRPAEGASKCAAGQDDDARRRAPETGDAVNILGTDKLLANEAPHLPPPSYTAPGLGAQPQQL